MSAAANRIRVSVELPVHGAGFAEVRALARAVEAAALDGVWVPDHLVPMRPGTAPPFECWTLLAAVAASTSRVTLGPLVLVLSLRDPALVALQARTLADLSGDRLVLGVGLGGFTYRRAARQLGIGTTGLDERARTLAASIERLRATAARDARRPIPLWVGGRSSSAIAAAARSADGWNCPFVEELAARRRDLDAACAAAGDVERLHVFGTPERAAERLRALADQGADEVTLHVAGDHASRLATIALLGAEVLPLLAR